LTEQSALEPEFPPAQAASGNEGTAIPLSMSAALTDTSIRETLSIKITGVPRVASLSAGTKNADGSWSLTAAQLRNLSLTAPAGSFSGMANLGVTATGTETNGSASPTSANLTVTDTNWHQVVFSGDASQSAANKMKFWLDGVQDTNVTQAGSGSFTYF